MSNTTIPETVFQEIIYSKLLDEELDWLTDNIQLSEKDELGNKFIMSYNLIFRFISNDKIEWNSEELVFLEKKYPSFSESKWSKQTICRALLMVRFTEGNGEKTLKKLMETCSVKELQDFYKNLFFLAAAPKLTSLVEEGIRTNTTDVFDAIALRNPYSANFLSEDAWNQLVLKAIFMERPLYKIYNLRGRNNEKLALMLNDYIKERWSAGRTVSPEVWQLMLGYNNPELQTTIKKASKSKNELEQRAAQLVWEERNPNAIEDKVAWIEIGKQFNNN